MKKYGIMIKENLKKQKGSFMGIAFLMFIISITITSVLCMWVNSGKYEEQEMDRLHFGNVVFWMLRTNQADSIQTQMEAIDEVDHVYSYDSICMNYEINGKKAGTQGYFEVYDEEQVPYKLLDESTYDYLDEKMEAKGNEIYVPISFQSIFDAKIGDTLSGLDVPFSFVIKGFFENPIDGTTTMGIKDMIISDEYMQKMQDYIIEKEESSASSNLLLISVMHAYEKADSSLSEKRLQQKINNSVDMSGTMVFSYTRSAFQSFMLMIEGIFEGFLLSFVLVLLIVALIVIGHSINSSIEQSYVDLGILKAIGYAKKDLCFVLFIQYLMILALGLFSGIGCSVFLVKLINHIITPVSGIKIPFDMPVGPMLLCFGSILVIFILFILRKVSMIGKISPMTAIRGGKSDVFFDSRLILKLHKKGLQFSLALRQLTSGKKRYVGAGMIAALLVFFLTFCMRIYGWLGPEGDGLKNSMGMISIDGVSYDFGIIYLDASIQEEVEKVIEKESPILHSYQTANVNSQLDGLAYLCTVVSCPENLHIIEGRECRYDNEITITAIVSEQLKLQIGDTILVSIDGSKKEMLVSGIHQCANDMGENIAMNQKAFASFDLEDQAFYQNYILKNKIDKDQLLASLIETYGEKIIVDNNNWSGIDGILDAANVLKIVMYVICTLFIFVVVYMTGSKILYKEQHDLGIYKSLGFCSNTLRISFALRFVIIAALGAFLGTLISFCVTDVIASKIFGMMGVGNFESPVSVGGMCFAILFVVACFFLFSYLISAKMKKTDPAILITE